MNIGSLELCRGTSSAAFLRSGEAFDNKSIKHGNPKLVIGDSDADCLSSRSSHYPLKPTLLGTSVLLKKRKILLVSEAFTAKSSVRDCVKEDEKASVVDEKKTRRKKKWKKPKDKPNRPLSAYNLFFAEMRAKMLGDDAPTPEQEALKKRVHCKTHGKIGFAVMARTIGAHWKALAADKKKVFEDRASKEKLRYQIELASWKEAQKYKPEEESECGSTLGLNAIATATMVSNSINPAGEALSSFHGATLNSQYMSLNMNMMSPSIQGTKCSSDSMRLFLENRMQCRNISRLHAVPPQAEYIRAIQDRPIDLATFRGLSAAQHQQHPHQRNQQLQQHQNMMLGGGERLNDGNYLCASEESANAILNHFQNGMPLSTQSFSHNLSSASSGHQMSPQSQASRFERESFEQFAAMRRLRHRYLASGIASRGMTGSGGGFGMNDSIPGTNSSLRSMNGGMNGGMNGSMNGMNGGMNGMNGGTNDF